MHILHHVQTGGFRVGQECDIQHPEVHEGGGDQPVHFQVLMGVYMLCTIVRCCAGRLPSV